MDIAFWLVIGIVALAAIIAGVCYRRKKTAEAQARQSAAALNDWMSANLMLKQSALESYKQMIRQPQPKPHSGIDWEEIPNNRRRF